MESQSDSYFLVGKPKQVVTSTRLRSTHGSVTPFLAVCVILMLGTVGISLDIMRDFEAFSELAMAAESAALYGLSLTTDSNANYVKAVAQANILSAITSNTGSWNKAESGPQNKVWSKPVTFDQSAVQFVNNPSDAQEFFLQVTAARNGRDALTHFFLPVLYTMLNGTAVPQAIKTFNTSRIIEVLGQPASRLGAGPPLGTASPGSRDADFIGFATTPLAISNQQFAQISNPNLTLTSYTIDLVSSTSAEYTQAAPAGHIKGCLVNVAAASPGNSTYGSGQGDRAIDQLEGLMNYFAGLSQQSSTPAVVENGSQLNGFDPADPAFSARRAEILQSFSQLFPPRSTRAYFAVPVIAQDPSFTTSNTVIGFAWVKLNQMSIDTAGNISVTITLGESVPIRNASCAQGFSSVAQNGGSVQLPAPVSPFIPRVFNASSNGVSLRPRGIVLAPALSPRLLSSF